ncbi:hypothetical protein GcC1_064007 [Golovinomyces cichoracearum]|uniref:Uncharacterized protein n=1 Tax=Golovinomyces cichoracearum TaxID=62708 RepID=A0A420ISA4_9PEZI|nr:hypothetical protein GcC1_064007 [Golovinomyces cichoracearum]
MELFQILLCTSSRLPICTSSSLEIHHLAPRKGVYEYASPFSDLQGVSEEFSFCKAILTKGELSISILMNLISKLYMKTGEIISSNQAAGVHKSTV